MSHALAKAQPTQLGDLLNDEQVSLIKATIAKGATNDELGLFLQTCKRLRLDPFARQIYLVKRWDSKLQREVAQTQVSIDGFRAVAERTGEYRGQTPPQWCGHDGAWRDVWLASEPPSAARIGVHRQGFAEPLYRVARFESYAQRAKDGKLTKMWATMPDVMIAMCAEALAMRAAFPNELGGVYSPDEMGQAENDAKPAPVRELPKPRTLDDVASVSTAFDENGAIQVEFEDDGNAEPANVQAEGSTRDEYGLEIPAYSCPIFASGPHKGQDYMHVPAGKLRALLAKPEWMEKASAPQIAWARYAVARHEAEKKAKGE